ncbi:NAD(P)H-dependent oxidoreductase [Pontibacter harenae]|uniref:NAD(P)H-dependent oxidoreductase n=1 Tax=Pontibacter harenae TaxID=2894083 RepID=UPI001E3DF589|nr:Gfo/Idh/MocA family oxidoreductase [Pontibacter harenae]MCC9168604.1 NAD(P)-dependent oxidoreductase [Pontibacter harenae]
MIIIDKHLQSRQQEGKPVRVGIIGAGVMAKGLVNQIIRYTPGMEVAAIANRTIKKALAAYEYTGTEAKVCNDLDELQQCWNNGGFAVTSDPELLCVADGIDIIVEMTGTIEYAANVVMKAIEHKKHVLNFNAELDATVGPMLKVYADQAGVLLSGGDGDQPGVIMNLYRFVKSIGLTPLLCGNIKGLQDYYRNPTTQKGFAAVWDMTPEMVTSFADGTKISFEQACVANATGMGVAKRGMIGLNYDGHVDDMTGMYDIEMLKEKGGIVDYVVGPKPGPGVFIYATSDDPMTQKYLDYGKLGKGPLYSFYTPYHLCYFELPHSIARIVLMNDVVMAPLAGPVVEVITQAKTDLKAGKKLDGLGGYDTYGQCENALTVQQENLLPIGLAEGAVLKRDIPRDQCLTFDDVELNEDSLVMRLYREQTAMFFPEMKEKGAVVS